MPAYRFTTALALAAVFLTSCTVPKNTNRRTAWQHLPLNGVSGLAPAGTQWIAIGDAKKPGEQRALLIQRLSNGTIQARSLQWIGHEPVDLESISAVPGTSNRFVAVTSRGEWFAVQLSTGGVEVIESGTLPGHAALKEVEGFSLVRIGNQLVAVWGTRGSDSEAGHLYWSDWTGTGTSPFSPVQSAEIRLPWPTKHVRHVSDLCLEPSGRLLVSSASDPGDRGPFSSAVWEVGRIEAGDAGLTWKPSSVPKELLRESPGGHKIEAISTDAGGTLVVASDDEALGSAIRF